MKKSIRSLALATACMTGFCAFSSAQADIQINVTAQGDASYWWARGAGSWWETGADSVGAHYYGFPGYVQYKYAFMQYDLSAITAPVISAKLYLNMVDISGPDAAVNVYHATNASSATGNATQAIGGDVIVHTFHTSDPAGWLAIDVTDALKTDQANGNPFACFNTDYRGVYDSGSTNYSFASGESATPSYLLVSIPEPASMGLLALGGLMLISRRR